MNTTEPTTLTIHGYDEWFAINFKVKVYKNDEYIGEVSKKESLPIEIGEDCTLTFKGGRRCATINIKKGVDSYVLLSFDRFSGKLKAIKANEDNLAQMETLKDQNAKIATIACMVLIATILIAALLYWEILPSLKHY